MIDLSIHLITYNNEKYIEETLKSILKQQVNFNYEIVVGDDCSTDETFKIIESYKEKHPTLFKIKKNETRLGIFKNFKVTLDRCEGTYVFDIAGDDLLKHEYSLQKLVDILKNNSNLGFVDSGVDLLIEKDGQNKTIEFCNKKVLSSSKETYRNNILLWNSPMFAGVCFNKACIYKFVDFDKYFKMNISFEDYPILVNLAMNTNFETIKESLHTYRMHKNSSSNKKGFENQLYLKHQEKILFDFFTKKYNFENNLINIFNKNHYRKLLFLSGYYEKKELGQESYKMLKNKNLKDYIHYFASQNKLFRKLISIV
ncbi:glycosyltransferase family 2 protein [Aestuariibaculum suncheonense]|uniref:Glycosyltransferase family 2 protein n=1 Tax=Aestuariibaculum suncheonense TaxID=1028745 RepID=A0A8J6Q688_9FLAO|nr:glycosyltransferase family 2 protein [Aestuariibaculum suncheonense]MBD0834505.1 glycosyltransferase family 2 protein [Aestuariibaculum suncheonense]